MLNILHQKINNIVEIIGIEEISINNFNIQYKNPSELTEIKSQQINTIISQWPLESAKLQKIQELDEKWNLSVNEGFTTPYGWKLGLKNSDVTLLTGAFLLGKEASSMNITQDATIVDLGGISRTINIQDLSLLMLQYGQYRTSLSTNYSNTKSEIENLQTIQEVNNFII